MSVTHGSLTHLMSQHQISTQVMEESHYAENVVAFLLCAILQIRQAQRQYTMRTWLLIYCVSLLSCRYGKHRDRTPTQRQPEEPVSFGCAGHCSVPFSFARHPYSNVCWRKARYFSGTSPPQALSRRRSVMASDSTNGKILLSQDTSSTNSETSIWATARECTCCTLRRATIALRQFQRLDQDRWRTYTCMRDVHMVTPGNQRIEAVRHTTCKEPSHYGIPQYVPLFIAFWWTGSNVDQ